MICYTLNEVMLISGDRPLVRSSFLFWYIGLIQGLIFLMTPARFLGRTCWKYDTYFIAGAYSVKNSSIMCHSELFYGIISKDLLEYASNYYRN